MNRRYPILPFEASRFEPFFGEEIFQIEAKLLSGGACNSNYLIMKKNGERYVCRMHQRGIPSIEFYITQLAQNSVPAVEYLWFADGVSVMAFIEGEHFTPTAKLMRNAGRLIAQLAEVEFEHAGEIKCDGSIEAFADWSSCSDGLLSLLEKETVSAMLPFGTVKALKKVIRANEGIFADFDRSKNLVHGDFRPDNILVSGESVVGILDWEFAHSGSSFMDIGNLLRHYSDEFEEDVAQGLVDGGFALPDDWRYRAYLIDLVSHLEFLTSNKSLDFKLECVERIEHLIKLSDTG